MSEASRELSPLILTLDSVHLHEVGASIGVCFPGAEATWLLAEGAECGVQSFWKGFSPLYPTAP